MAAALIYKLYGGPAVVIMSYREDESAEDAYRIAGFAALAANKRYFRDRIPYKAIERFVAQLRALGELQPPQEESVAYSRDPNDDYLIVYGVINGADYLVTGDQDLLVLGSVGKLPIVTPVQSPLALARSGGFQPSHHANLPFSTLCSGLTILWPLPLPEYVPRS